MLLQSYKKALNTCN